MKTISVFILLVIISPFLMAQITFEKTYGALEDEIGYCVEQTNDEGFILCGTTKSYDPYYLSKFYLVKTDRYGTKDWEKVFGVADFGELLISIRQTDDDGYIACGQTNGPGDGSDFYLVKFTPGGDTSWTKKFNKGANDLAEWIEITRDNGYILCGMAKMTSTDADIYIVKTDQSGQVTWDKTIDVGKLEHGHCIQQTTDNGYIICGLQEDRVTHKGDVLLVKTNETGDTAWTRKFGTELDDVGFVVRQTSDEGYIICGYTFVNDLNTQVYLIKTNPNGIQEWAKTYGGFNFDFGYSLDLTNDNGYILCGNESSFQYAQDDLYLIRTQANGDTLWTRHIGGADDDEGFYVRETSDHGFIVCGRTASMGAGEDDIYMIKTDVDGYIGSTSLNEKSSEKFRVYPNPSDGLITLQINTEVNLIEISDCKGILVYSNPINDSGDHLYTMDLSHLTKGIYIIRIDTLHGSVYRELILQQ